MGLGGLEPPTSSLSGMRSNQLSYKPLEIKRNSGQTEWSPDLKKGPATYKKVPKKFRRMVTHHNGPSYPLERR